MAKQVIYIEETVLRRLVGGLGHYETESCVYLPLECEPKIEIVPSPRPIDRDHLRRDFNSELKDFAEALDSLQTVARHLGYMKTEI